MTNRTTTATATSTTTNANGTQFVTFADQNGRELGTAARSTRSNEWSLSTSNGMDLLRMGTDLDDAGRLLAQHADWLDSGDRFN